MKALTVLLLFFMNEQPRQVLLFYNESGKTMYEQQIGELNKNQAGIKERDIDIKSYALSDKSEEWKMWKIDSSKPFTFILVGRDGGEKHRSNEMVSVKELFGKIDAMPMRKSEVRNN